MSIRAPFTLFKVKTLHELFEAGLIVKAINATAEIVGGIALFVTPVEWIKGAITFLTSSELIEDPTDFWVRWLVHSSSRLSALTTHSLAFYLLSHGVLKAIVLFMVWKKHAWAYPLLIALLCLFAVYEGYTYFFTHSLWLIALCLIDVAVAWLTWREYRRVFKARTLGQDCKRMHS